MFLKNNLYYVFRLLIIFFFLIVLSINKWINQPYFSPFLGPFVVTIFLIFIYWVIYYLGFTIINFIYNNKIPRYYSWPIIIIIGFIGIIFYMLILGLTHLINLYAILVPCVLLLYLSFENLEKKIFYLYNELRVNRYNNLLYGKLLVIICSVIVFLGLFTQNILRTEFQQDSIDVYHQYLPIISYYIKTGSIHPLYFIAEMQINPKIFSGLLYTFILSLSNVYALSFFSISLIILTGITCYYFSQNIHKSTISFFVPLILYLSFLKLYSLDLGLNILKYNHLLTLLVSLVPFYLLYYFNKYKDYNCLIIISVICGIMLGDFSPGFPVILPAIFISLIYIDVNATMINQGRYSYNYLIFIGIMITVGCVPYVVNYYYCGAPFESVNFYETFRLRLPFVAFEEYSNKIENYINFDYWRIGLGFNAHKVDSDLSFIQQIGYRTITIYFIYFGIILSIYKHNDDINTVINLTVLISCIIFSILPVYFHKARYQVVILPLLAPYFVYFIDMVTKLINKSIIKKGYNYLQKET